MATAFPAKLSTPLRYLIHRYPAASTTISLSSRLTADTFPVFLAPPQTKLDVNGFISAEHLRSLGRVDSPVVMTTQSLAHQAVVELARRRVVNSDDDDEEDDNIGAVSGDDEFDDVFDDEFDEEFDDDDEDEDDDDDEKPRRRSICEIDG